MENNNEQIIDSEVPIDEFSLNVFSENIDPVDELSESMKQQLTLEDEQELLNEEAPTSTKPYILVFYNLPPVKCLEKLRNDVLKTLKKSHLIHNGGKQCQSILEDQCFIKCRTNYEYRLRTTGYKSGSRNAIVCSFMFVKLTNFEEGEFLRKYWDKSNYYGNKLCVFWSHFSRDQKPTNSQ